MFFVYLVYIIWFEVPSKKTIYEVKKKKIDMKSFVANYFYKSVEFELITFQEWSLGKKICI